MRACVIGAGAAGICAARHVLSLKNLQKLVVFEQTGSIGGTWVYSDSVGCDMYGLPIHSSMYKKLRTNLPKEVMAFPDFPFEKKQDSFLSHQAVQQYLQDYANWFNLTQFIRFRAVVVRVILQQDEKETWQVEWKNLLFQTSETEEFDVVFVCSGHYSTPKIPAIEGNDEFRGKILHSHNYRSPEEFSGQRVACLGAGASGIDIASELSATCVYVYLCHEFEQLKAWMPSNVCQKPGFKRFTSTGVILKSGERLEVDSVVLCTGYEYDFPFFDKESLPLRIEDNRLTPLYQHLVHIEHPSLFFIGLCIQICPFPQFHVQLLYSMAVLEGKCQLPSKAKMYDWEEADYRHRMEVLKLRENKAHYLGPHQWEYNRNLCKLGGFPCPVSPAVEGLYDHVREIRKTDAIGYKKMNFELVNENEFRSLS